MYELDVEVENNKLARKFTFKGLREYETIMTRAAASMLCQLEYWWPRKKGPEVYKTDQEFADEIGVSLSHFKAIKKYLSKIIKLFKTRVAFLNGKKVTYYGEIDYAELDRLISAKKDTLKSKNNTLVKYENQTLLNQSKVRKSDYDGTKIRLCTIYTDTTTDITNNPAGLENNLPPNQSGLGNLSNDQKSGSEVDRSACREEIILEETPTPKNEESNLEEKAVEPPLPTLKADDVKTPNKSKGKGKNKKHGSLTEEQQSQFEKWYALYPRREGRYRAEQAFAQAILECDLDTMINLTQKYAKQMKDEKKETQHIKLPTTWLNSRPWHDLKDVAKVSDKPAEVKHINVPQEFEGFLAKYPNIDKSIFVGATLDLSDNMVIIRHADHLTRHRLGDHTTKFKNFFNCRIARFEDVVKVFQEVMPSGNDSKSLSTQVIQLPSNNLQEKILSPREVSDVCALTGVLFKEANIEIDSDLSFRKFNELYEASKVSYHQNPQCLELLEQTSVFKKEGYRFVSGLLSEEKAMLESFFEDFYIKIAKKINNAARAI